MKLSTLIAAVGCLAAVSVEAQLAYPLCNSTTPCPTNFVSCFVPNPCKMGSCETCNSGYRLDMTTSPYSCVQSNVNVDGSCTKSAQCTGVYTYCNANSKCACTSSTYTVRGDKTDCDPPAPPAQMKLNSPCNTTMYNCGDGATCTVFGWANSTCQCQTDYKPYDDTDCTHPVTNNADVGQTCSYANYQLCKSGLSCGICPGSTSTTYICISTSGSSNFVGSATALMIASALLLVIKRTF